MPVYKVDPVDPLPRYYQVYASLKNRVQAGEFGPGDALPSERQLVDDYGVSRITIVKAMDLLVKEGLVERQHGRGNFVTEPSTSEDEFKVRKVAFFIANYLEPYLFSILNGAISVATSRGFQLQIVGAYLGKGEAWYVNDAIRNGADGIILYPGSGYSNEALYRELWDKNYPLVMVDRYYPNLAGDYVIFDDETAGYELTKRLIQQGHERIAILTSHEVSVTSVHHRIKGYRKALETYGLAYDEDLVWLDLYQALDFAPEHTPDLQTTHTKLLAHIDAHHPSALIAINNDVVEQLGGDLMKIKTGRMQAVIDGSKPAADYELNIAIAGISYRRPVNNAGALVALGIQSGETLGQKAMDLVISRIEKAIPASPTCITVPMEVIELT